MLLALAAAIAYLTRNSLAVAESTIREDLGISESTMGFLLGPAFFWPYALAQIPGGWLGDRLGARKTLPLLSIVWSAASACFGVARGATLLVVGRIGGGLAQAGLLPSSASTVSRWHPPVERAMASGSLGAAMSIGGASGAALTGELLEIMSWRWIFILYAIPGILWSLLFYWWFRNEPSQHPDVSAAELKWIEQDHVEPSDTSKAEPSAPVKPSSNSLQSWMRLLTNLSVWMICLQQFFRAAGYAFFASWFATYLQETRGVSTAKSGWLLTVPLLASVGGALAGGALSDAIVRRTRKLWIARSLLASLALGICAALVFSAWFVPSATGATLLIGAGAFFAALAGPSAYASTMDLGGREVTNVFSTMNMVGNFGAGLIPWLVPTFRRWVETNGTLMQWMNGNSWNAVLLLFGYMYIMGAVCWLLVRPDRPISPTVTATE